jgi:hypothetical protein
MEKTATPALVTPTKCTKFGEVMQEGFVPSAMEGGLLVPFWLAGEPQRGFFGVKWRNKERHSIVAFRCPKCGYLELYAPT